MIVHCNTKFKPYVIWFLCPSDKYFHRSIEFGICPRCLKDVATLIEYRKADNVRLVENYKGAKVNDLRERFKGEVEYKSTDLIMKKGSPYQWKYGVNTQKIDKKTGEVTIKQSACDFYGNKEVIKEFKQVSNSTD